MDVDPILAAIQSLNNALGIFAKFTPTTVDDTIHDGLEAALHSSALIAFIKKLAGDTDAMTLLAAGNHEGFLAAAEKHSTSEIRAAVAAQGIDWQKWLAIVMAIVQMIQPFLPKK